MTTAHSDHAGLIRLDTNASPVDPPEVVVAAVRSAASRLRHYPDRAGTRLREAIAAQEGVSAEQVAVGTGSSEVIADAWLSAAAAPGPRPGAAVFTTPAFILYELACLRAGLVPATVPAGPGCRQDLARLAERAADPSTRLLAVSSPHNPTGPAVGVAELRGLLDAVPERVLVVVDEAYRDFVDAADRPDAAALLDRHPNLLVTRTFSKAYGLAGLRVGYGLGSRGLIARLRRQQLLFGVSEVAEAAVLAWLGVPQELDRRVRATVARRDELAAGLARRGFEVVPSQANFVLAADGAGRWAPALLRAGIAVHAVGDAIRVGVGREHEQARLFATLDRLRPDPSRATGPATS